MNPKRGQLVLIGWIVGTHGVRGEVRVKPCAGSPDRFLEVARVFLGPADTLTDVDADADARVGEDGYRPVSLESSRTHGSLALLSIARVASPADAQALRGMGLFLPAA